MGTLGKCFPTAKHSFFPRLRMPKSHSKWSVKVGSQESCCGSTAKTQKQSEFFENVMLTDAPLRKNPSGFLESDCIKTLDLRSNGDLLEIAQRLECARKADKIRDVRSACADFLATASD